MSGGLDVAAARGLFGDPVARALEKESAALDERTAGFVAASPFVVLATAGPDGTCDVAPKGGPPGFVRVLGPARLALPEFPGNRRFDGLGNLVGRPGVALLFLVPGISETLRVNGEARVSREPGLLEACAVDGRAPWFVLDVEVRQVFSHCGKAFLRSRLWQPARWPAPESVPSPSRTIAERAAAERRPEADVRREVERGYAPGLY